MHSSIALRSEQYGRTSAHQRKNYFHTQMFRHVFLYTKEFHLFGFAILLFLQPMECRENCKSLHENVRTRYEKNQYSIVLYGAGKILTLPVEAAKKKKKQKQWNDRAAPPQIRFPAPFFRIQSMQCSYHSFLLSYTCQILEIWQVYQVLRRFKTKKRRGSLRTLYV